MNDRIMVATKDLPPSLKDALASVGYGRSDVAVVVETSTQLASAYGDGYRAFAIGVNLATGQRTIHHGAWGGENPFSRPSAVDQRPTLEIPPGAAIVTGQEGGGRPVSATIHVSPGSLAPNVLAPVADVTDRERSILAIFGGLKSAYRAEYLTRSKVTAEEIDALIARGFLSRNKSGATQITTAGKNARGNARAF